MVKEVSNIEPSIEIYDDTVSKENVVSFEIESDDSDYLKMISKSLNGHRYNPLKNHEQVKSSDFGLSIESSNPKDIEMMTEININFLQDQINILTSLVGKSYTEIAGLSEKIESMYDYMDKSGLFKYKPVIDYIVGELNEKDILSKEAVDKYVEAPLLN